jgi:hypothetical protein
MNYNFEDHFIDDEENAEELNQPHEETPQEREEREIKEATIERRGSSLKILLAIVAVAMAMFLAWWIWQYYFHTYRISQEKGWIMKVSNEGSVFKTVEGEMISENYVQDTLLAMHSDFLFSITDDSLVRDAMSFAGDGRRVVLTYNEYKGTVLWRGSSKHVVTKIELDSVRIKPNPYK